MSIDQFWHVTYHKGDSSGQYVGYGLIAESEDQARSVAAGRSRQHGTATVTNREGLVATYVNGTERPVAVS